MTSSLASALLRSARSTAGQLTRLARSKAPRHLQSGITSSATEESEGVIRITLKVKGADARAQEYGSGHQDRKNPHDIKIFPKNGKMLVFLGTHGYGNEFSQYNPNTKQGVGEMNIVLTPKVLHHPGIHAVNDGQGYARPALKEFREHLRTGDFPEQIKKAIVSDIRRSFGGKNA